MIPTYNCADYLRETLASVLAQDPGRERMQIEVVDDASEDDPEAVVRELGAGRVTFVRQAENVGHSANFNTCLKRSRGHLVHLLHGDDCVREGFYAAMERPFLDYPEMGAGFCRHIYMDEDGHWERIARLHQVEPGPFARAAERLLALSPAQPPGVVVRRGVYELLGGFDTRIGVAGEDSEMLVRIAADYPIWYQPEPLALYRRRPGSMIAASMRSGRNVRDARRACELKRAHVPRERQRAAVRAARARYAEWGLKNAGILVGQGDGRGAIAQSREAVLCSPQTVVRSLALTGARLLSDGHVEPVPLARGVDTAANPRAHRSPLAPVPDGETRPLWSVMIPTYNCADYLRETLASVLAQDPGRERMQIEVVDDASEDDPEAVVRELGAGRVTFVRQAENVGHSANFNTCLKRSRGHLVHLLHGDDCVREGFYAAMEQVLQAESEAGAGFCRYIATDAAGHWGTIAPLERRSPGVISDWLGKIAVGQRLQTPCMVVRRQVYERLGGFDWRGGAEDWEMWVRIAAHYPVVYEPQPLALYRVHSLSRTGRRLRSGGSVRDLRRVIAANREHFAPEVADEITRRALREAATTCLRRARRLLGEGDSDAMWAQLREAIRSDASPRVLAGAAIVVAGRMALPLLRRKGHRSS